MERKLYEMIVDDELVEGVFAMSLVDEPAIEVDFTLLSKNDKFRIDLNLEKNIDTTRHVVMGPMLIPDKVIPRKNYDIIFSKDTIRRISENFMIQGKKDNVTIQHKVNVNKIYLIESWIVEDTEKDKSANYGYKLPVGTWCGTYKVNDDNLWNEFIKNGILKGFSLEGNFGQNEIHMHEELSEEDKLIYDLYLAVNFTSADLNSKYQWKLFNEENPCPSCIVFSNKIKKLSEWLNIAIPRHPHGVELGTTGVKSNYPYQPYGCFCEDKCKCRLIKVTESRHPVTVIKPF